VWRVAALIFFCAAFTSIFDKMHAAFLLYERFAALTYIVGETVNACCLGPLALPVLAENTVRNPKTR